MNQTRSIDHPARVYENSIDVHEVGGGQGRA